MRTMIEPNQSTTGRMVQPPSRGTGWTPPRNDGTAHPDSFASRMRDTVIVFPESVHFVYPKLQPHPRTGAPPSGMVSE